MPRCVICRLAFTPGAVEHILPNALGWSRFTSNLVCPTCNAGTSTVDARLVASVQPLITLIDPPGRRTPPPAFRPGQTEYPVSVGPGGALSMPDEFVFEKDGERWVSVASERLEEFEARMAGRGRAVEFVGQTNRTYIPDAVVRILDLNPPASVLALGKAAIHFAALKVGDWERNGEGADAIRGALIGAANSVPGNVFAWDFDQPDLGETDFYHGLELYACPQLGTIGVRVHIFGLIRVRFTLTDSYRGENHQVVRLIRDPATGRDACSSAPCPHPLPWLFARQRTAEYPTGKADAYFRARRHLIKPDGWDDQRDEAE